MSKKRRPKKKQEARKQTTPSSRRTAPCGPTAAKARPVVDDQQPKARRANGSNGANGANGHNGANGSNGSNGSAAERQRTAAVTPPVGHDGAPVDGAPAEEPLQKGDMVVIRMRSAWELEGELRAINDEVVRIFDFAVCDVLRLRRKDIERIERLVDAD